MHYSTSVCSNDSSDSNLIPNEDFQKPVVLEDCVDPAECETISSHQGILRIPCEWTDKADPEPYQRAGLQPSILFFPHLQELSDFIAVKLRESHKNEGLINEN